MIGFIFGIVVSIFIYKLLTDKKVKSNDNENS